MRTCLSSYVYSVNPYRTEFSVLAIDKSIEISLIGILDCNSVSAPVSSRYANCLSRRHL